MRGFLDKISANKNFEVVTEAECLGQLEVAMPVMEELIKTHPEINIVMALNDLAAMGALAALYNVQVRGAQAGAHAPCRDDLSLLHCQLQLGDKKYFLFAEHCLLCVLSRVARQE